MFTAMPLTDSGYQADAGSKSKYVKVKKTTYNKYKKAYQKQASLNKTISNQKLTIANQKAEISELKLVIKDQETTIKDKKQTISWLWGTLEDFGFEYNYDSHQWETTITEEDN